MILIVAEHADGKLKPITGELAIMGRSVAQELAQPLACVVLGNVVDSVQDDLGALGLDQIITIRDRNLERYTSDAYVAALGELVGAKAPILVIAGHTSVGYDFIPRLAAGMGKPAIAGCIGYQKQGDRQLGPDRGAEAVLRDWHFRRDSASGGNAVVPVHCGNQQGSRRTDIQDCALWHRR
jgi:electron transfer flavoprotein alpha subunit